MDLFGFFYLFDWIIFRLSFCCMIIVKFDAVYIIFKKKKKKKEN